MRRMPSIWSTITGFLAAALFVFMSCASQDANDGDPLEELAGEGGGFSENSENFEDPSSALGDLDADPVANDAPVDPGLPSEEELAETAEGGGYAPPAEDLGSPLPSDPELDDVLGLPSDKEIRKAEAEDRLQQERMAKAEMDTLTDGLNMDAPWSGASRVPQIPEGAVNRKGSALNRFYFVRAGDTAESVSSLIYGNPGRAKELKAWNKGAWKAGKLVYYQSPINPADPAMQSFYKERGIESGEYTVKKGDWLSRIAKQLLGSTASWKELAVINGLNSADAIEPGQRLAVYSSNLSGGGSYAGGASPSPSYTGGEAVPGYGSDPTGAPTPSDSYASAETPGFQADPGVQFAPPVPNMGAPKKPAKKHSFDLARFLQQEIFTIVIGAVGLIFLVVLLMANKRRKARRAATEEVNEDIFGSGQ